MIAVQYWLDFCHTSNFSWVLTILITLLWSHFGEGGRFDRSWVCLNPHVFNTMDTEQKTLILMSPRHFLFCLTFQTVVLNGKIQIFLSNGKRQASCCGCGGGLFPLCILVSFLIVPLTSNMVFHLWSKLLQNRYLSSWYQLSLLPQEIFCFYS